MSPIVLSKEKRRQYHQNKTRSMSPIVYLERKEDITPKQNKSSMSPIVLSKEKRRQ